MIYTKNVNWCNAYRWNFNIVWLKVDSNQKIITHRNIQNGRDVDQSKPFYYRVFKCQMDQFLKASITSDGRERSPHVREYGFRNLGKFYSRNPEYSFRNPKSHLRLEFRIQNPKSQFHRLQRLESTTWITESTAWNQESKTVLDQTRTQSLLCMHCDLWEGFSESVGH